MVYSGLELGQFFELESGAEDISGCHNVRKLPRSETLQLHVSLSDVHVDNSTIKDDSINLPNAIYL